MSHKIKVIKRHKELPTPQYVHAMAEINGQTARGAAIAGTAYLDLLLRSALERHMRQYPELQDALFENRGHLQNFSARIQVAFAFKIIGHGAYLDLLILRNIRNAFAHSADAFDFNRADIAALCDELWYPSHIQYSGRGMPSSAREKFIRSVEFLADGLLEAEARTKPEHGLHLPATFIQLGPPYKTASSPKKSRTRSSR
jgi:hypothetical protein